MAFGYEYWLTFLPDVNPESFLLFVHRPDGATKLRDYSSGKERVVGQPPVGLVFAATQIGKTRFQCDPHPTTDPGFWHQKILELNRRHLRVSGSPFQASAQQPAEQSERRRQVAGRALRGSQRQLQDYVNDHPDALSQAVLGRLPARMSDLGARIRWVSPLAEEKYCEYRDADFLQRVGLSGFTKELAEFWPALGPSWDALGVISDAQRKLKPGVVLVEAKSHIPEIYGSGCQASPESRLKIETALNEAKLWCGASHESDWLGPLYQSANRIAHLYFIFNRLQTPAWLVNLYFTDDPIGPTSREAWGLEVLKVKGDLGLAEPVRNMIEVFLPALPTQEVADAFHAVPQRSIEIPAEEPPMGAVSGFESWTRRWIALANFAGSHLPEPQARIQQVLDLWDEPIPGSWERGFDTQLLGNRYRRGDFNRPHAGEHSIEHEILCGHFAKIRCLGGNVVDGINAMPLVRDERGGRLGNVEADLLLLVEIAGSYSLILCEVKHSANTPWYAAIENLRQLRLFHESAAARQLFHRRNPGLILPERLQTVGLVVAPAEYYSAPGQKANVVPYTTTLLQGFGEKTGIGAHLTMWDPDSSSIRKI